MDIIVHRTAASAENENLDVAIHRMETLLDHILTTTGADSYRAFLGSDTNFRKQIFAEYKANRTTPKPKWFEECKEYSIKHFNAEIAKQGLEADDELGINQSENTIICSLDKDLLTVHGKHFQWAIQGGAEGKRWNKPDTFHEISELQGWRNFYYQCLVGDSSDNIKGVVGVGKVGAEALLSICYEEKDMFDAVRDAYGNDEEFIMNASCLYILRDYEDSFNKVFERNK